MMMMKKSISESNKDDDLMCGGGGGGGAPDEDKRKRAASGGATMKKLGSSGSGGAISMKSCQAEKCSADLSDAKTYHRRHKVCEHHAKAQVVVVAGIRQRFCQQCSRFHDISEFDETKRSCRRRLAGHNERRRKNPADIYSQVAEGGTSSTSGSSRNKGGSDTSSVPLMKDMHIQESDHRGRIQMMTVQENANYNKHFHIR